MMECVQDMYSRIKINFFVIITSFDCGARRESHAIQECAKKRDMYLWYNYYVLHMCCTHVEYKNEKSLYL